MGERLTRLLKIWGFQNGFWWLTSKRKVLTNNSAAEAGNGNLALLKGDLLDTTKQGKTKTFEYGAFYFTADGDFRHFYTEANCMKEFVTILKKSDPYYSLMRVEEFYRDKTEKGNETE